MIKAAYKVYDLVNGHFRCQPTSQQSLLKRLVEGQGNKKGLKGEKA